MVDLTPEEKQKIYAEEKVRLEAQEKLKEEKKKKDSKNAGIGCLIIIGIIAVIYIISLLSPSSGPKKESSTPTLNATVHFSGTQIIIKNNDAFNWTNVRLEINSGLLDRGYHYEFSELNSGKTATIGVLNFAKTDGTRLNPLAVKPQEMTIYASTPSGDAVYVGKWN